MMNDKYLEYYIILEQSGHKEKLNELYNKLIKEDPNTRFPDPVECLINLEKLKIMYEKHQEKMKDTSEFFKIIMNGNAWIKYLQYVVENFN